MTFQWKIEFTFKLLFRLSLFLTFSKCNFDVNLFRFVEMPSGTLFTQRKINNNNNSREEERILLKYNIVLSKQFRRKEILGKRKLRRWKKAKKKNKMKMFKFRRKSENKCERMENLFDISSNAFDIDWLIS